MGPPEGAPDVDLKDRVALVTGVGRRAGIGAAIARELAGAGAKVFVSFLGAMTRRSPGEAMPPCPRLSCGSFGVTRRPTGASWICPTRRRPRRCSRRAAALGRVDILVNNAAHWEAGGIEQVDASQLDRHFAVNARAAVLLCAEFARHKVAGSPGRSSTSRRDRASVRCPAELAYAVTKAALDALTVSLSAELANRHITVNAVDPGPTDTGWMTASVKAALEAASPTGTVASPQDVARVVGTLVSEAAARVTGQIVRVRPGGTA